MESIEIAFLTLAALLIGALLPLIFQARSTLRSLQTALEVIGPRLDGVAVELLATTQEFRTVAKDVAATMERTRGTASLVSTVGVAIVPALVAAVQAYRAAQTNGADPAANDDAPTA